MRRTLVTLIAGAALGACATAAVQSSTAAPAPGTAAVVSLTDAPKVANPPGTATVAHLARGHNAYLGRLEMNAGAAVPEHQDATEEYIHVLEGSGTITIDGVASAVSPGTTIYMPANATVSYQNGEEKMVAIQVFAGPAPAAKYDNWAPPQ